MQSNCIMEPLIAAEPELVCDSHDQERFGALGTVIKHVERFFCVRERKSTFFRELRAGMVTWVTMSYIVVVNPMILSAASAVGAPLISFRAACHATCITAAISSAFVGITANLPFGLAAGMGLNSYLRYGMVDKLGLSPDAAFGCCFVQAAIFGILAATGIVDRLQDILPVSLKASITVAIGVFQAFVGFQMMGLVVKSSVTLVTLGDLAQPGLWLSATATLLVAALSVRKTKGALLAGILFTAMAANILDLPNMNKPTSIGNAAGASIGDPATIVGMGLPGLDFSAVVAQPQDFATALLCMLFIVIFDTAGVQYGIGQQAGLLDGDGKVPGAKFAYLASAVGTAIGALMGTSPVIIHNETAVGVQEGGRTGLCAVTTAFLFLVSPSLIPLIELIPPEATAPCLVLVGTMMMIPVREVDFTDLRVALPAFLTICVTPLTYSISAGIFAGVASYFTLSAMLRLAEGAEHLGVWMGFAMKGSPKCTYIDVEGESALPEVAHVKGSGEDTCCR